ncbi:MAG: HpaII family restriction endonuclease [Pedobacter sp.]|nr:HpaII family restriction endonuclease [Chitinophagaceae bacterium]
MNTTLSSIPSEKIQHHFAHLKNKMLGKYHFIYRINDGYSIKEFGGINNKNQLLFQRIDNKVQHLNLMLVDSIFPLILSDVVVEALLNEGLSFSKYINSKKHFIVNDMAFDSVYFKYKFKQFIHYLLFSNICSNEVCEGIIDYDRKFYLKNYLNELQYYSIYEQKELQNLLFEKVTLNVDKSASAISANEISICLEILVK